MKDAKHHLRHVQKKVMKAAKEGHSEGIKSAGRPQTLDFKRPKTVLNKRKYS